MIDGLKSYPEYKDSGVPWLGQIPAKWNVMRQRHVAKMLVSNVDKHTVKGELPVRLCNYVDVYKNEFITERLKFMRATATPVEVQMFRLQKGDVLITKDSEEWNDIGVPALVEYAAEDLVCGYHLAILRPRQKLLQGDFFLRALQCPSIATQFHVSANGVTRFGLSQGDIKGVLIPVPPVEEQFAIVRFLNHSNGRIEQVIRQKKKLMALLNEQKQSIVHRAVTRGLNPKVDFKPSGLPWLGDIPKHWEVSRSKYVFREVDDRSATGQELRLSMCQKRGLIPSSEIEVKRLVSESAVGAKICEAGDLVLNRLKAHLGVFALASVRGLVSPDYTILRPARAMCPRYFELIYRTPACRVELRKRAKGIVQGFWRLYTDDFYDIRVPVPPVPEQEKIVKQLDADLATLNTALARTEREIGLLREYRTRLVADVVTGKLDVRAAATKLPAEIEIPSENVAPDESAEEIETEEAEA